jgi:hypothetical protein
VRDVRNRLHEARRQCDFSALAAELIGPAKTDRHANRLTKHTGLDEGPEL